MAIQSTAPTIIEAQPEKRFDLLGFPSITIEYFDPAQEPRVRYQHRNFRDVEGGGREWAPDGPYERSIENLYTEAATRAAAGDPRLAQACELILSILAEEVAKQ